MGLDKTSRDLSETSAILGKDKGSLLFNIDLFINDDDNKMIKARRKVKEILGVRNKVGVEV